VLADIFAYQKTLVSVLEILQLGVTLLLLFVFGLLNMIRAIFIGDITLVIVFGLIAVIGAAALYKLAPEK
jgi:hypothetical protein